MSEELKTCPFCQGIGAVYSIVTRNGKKIWFVKCTRCRAQGSTSEYAEEAVSSWNVRPDDKEVAHDKV